MDIMIGNGDDWNFVNGKWIDSADRFIKPADKACENVEEGLQGFRFAFLKNQVYTDFNASFKIHKLWGDAGLIFRATDKSDFYLLHFPQCAQIWRTHSFYAMLSKMDETGYLKIISIELVRCIDSYKKTHDIEVSMNGGNLYTRIDGKGVFEASNLDIKPGRIGLAQYYNCLLSDVSIVGTPQKPLSVWNEDVSQPTNWFYPCNFEEINQKYGRFQLVVSLISSMPGELFMHYQVCSEGCVDRTIFTTNSRDGGRNWDEPKVHEADANAGVIYHVFPDNKLRCLAFSNNCLTVSETNDNGSSWSAPRESAFNAVTGKTINIHMLLNVPGDATLMFLYTADPIDDSMEFSWGEWHTQAFACRSTDGGYTWSDFANLDGSYDPLNEKIKVKGNMDMNEVAAVVTSEGKILAFGRPNYSPWFWETWSNDGGMTWTPAVFGPFAGSAPSNMIKTKSGYILLVHRFPELSVNISADDGKTWDQGTIIDTGLWAMGRMYEVEPDVVLCIYGDSFATLMRAQYFKVTSRGLMPFRKTECK